MLGTGISLKKVSSDFTRFEVHLKRRWYNRNLVGTHFGGSLYSMCDPWYMFILIANLGKGYIVWDKAASIKFKKPGKGLVIGVFQISKGEIESIRDEINQIGKKDYVFKMNLVDKEGEVISEVEKVVYVRKKNFDWDSKSRV